MRSDGDSASLLSSVTDEDCPSVTLDPMEHEWMLCASDGLWESLQPLLAVEAGLVAKKDFVTGFTCLHWAAKQGKAELLSQLLKFAMDNNVAVNVNVKSGAGYTPLHLAAMHGHTQVRCGRVNVCRKSTHPVPEPVSSIFFLMAHLPSWPEYTPVFFALK